MKRLAVLCPGQGSQYISMGKDLFDEFSKAREIFEEASDMLGFDLAKMCFEGNEEELTLTENVQPAILAYSYAMYKVYSDLYGLDPICFAGHSLGEYTALTCSNAMNFADAIKIVRKRGKYMQEAAGNDGAMAAVLKCNREDLSDLCRKYSNESEFVGISNYNSSKQMVLSGNKNVLSKVVEELNNKSVLSKYLKVSAPFHSAYMIPAAKKLENELKKYQYNNPEIPVISNYTAQPYEDSSKIVEYLTCQLYNPVRWVESMDYMEAMRINTSIEIGPKAVLTKIMKEDKQQVKAFSFDLKGEKEKFLEYMKPTLGEPTVITRCMAIAVCTKNSNWNEEEYTKGVSIPYREVEKMQEQIEQSEKYPTKEQMLQALEMLKSVFVTKGTPMEEQKERFEQIFRETETKDLFNDFQISIGINQFDLS